MPAAVLWDMDGTLVDTERYWLAAQDELVHSYGGTWTHEDGLSLVGSGLWRAAGIIQARGVALTEDQIVDTLTARVMESIQTSVPWRPGARELLTSLKAAGIPTALVTMSIRSMALHVASLAPDGAFDQVVAGDDVIHSKPHPEPYLRGAEILGVDVTECVAIEDSTTGLTAAVASGAVAIGVPLHSELDASLGYTIWPTLDGKTVEDIRSLFASKRARA